MYGNTDKPIDSIEKDTFGIKNYIDGLCKFILNCDTPMTISIQGDWGSGKTSMMKMIESQISSDVYPIWFNTWQFSQFRMQDELTVSMLTALLSSLNTKGEAFKKVKELLGTISKKAIRIGTDIAIGGEAAETLGKMMDGVDTDYAEQIKGLKDNFEKAVDEKLNSENKTRAVIFIDDLDRLQPAKAVELLEVLKSFLDCEQCVYVLAVDYSVVTQGIKQKFGDYVDEAKGKSFFDKIIQLPFKMPVAQYKIKTYISDMFDKMKIKYTNDTLSDYVSLIESSIGCNPRGVKRLFNTYFLLDIISKMNKSVENKESYQKLLFASLCMQAEFEELYNFIVSTSDTLDVDFFNSFSEGLTSNSDIMKEIGINNDDTIERINVFMKKFIKVMQLDDDENISDEEIENLKEILSFSTVTSVNNEESLSEENNKDDWHYRPINKGIVNAINEKIKKEFDVNFKLWQPRKNKGTRRISSANGIYYGTINNISYEFDYILSTDYQTKTTILKFGIYPQNGVNSEELQCLIEKTKNNYIKYDWGFKTNSILSLDADREKEDLVSNFYNQIKNELNLIIKK